MKELANLIHLISKFSPSKLPLLNQEQHEINGLESRLYQNIKTGKYKNQNEALIDLYGNEESYYKFQMLKSRLRQKLYNHLYFINDNTRTPKIAEKRCFELMHQAKSLLHIVEYSLAEEQFNKAYKIASQYEFTSAVLECLTNLNYIHTQLYDQSKFHETLKKIKNIRALKNMENQAYEIYHTQKLELHKSVKSQKKALDKLPQVVKQLKDLWEESQSYNIFYQYYMLNNWHLELIGDFNKKIETIENCEKLLKLKAINRFRFDTRLNKYSLIYALFRAQKYEKALQLAPQYLSYFDPFSRNWFAYLSNYFLLAVHAESYKTAEEIIQKVDQNPYFSRLKQKQQESWILYKSYFSFFDADKNNTSTFQYQKFISSVPGHSKDKLGHNISILILQFLYLLKNKEFEQLYSKEDTLRKYAHSYLKTEHSKRSFYFFKLMLVAIRTDFDPEKSIRKGELWFKKLKNAPEPGDAYAVVEIIPYEKLWEMVLGLLD